MAESGHTDEVTQKVERYHPSRSTIPKREDVTLPSEKEHQIEEALQRTDLTHDQFYSLLRTDITVGNIKARLDAMDVGVDPDVLIGQFIELTGSESYAQLLVEPHIALRSGDFIRFIENHPKPLPSPEELRQEYIADENRFPVVDYYRAIFATDEAANRVELEGFPNKAGELPLLKRDNIGPLRQSGLDIGLFIRPFDVDAYSHINMFGGKESILYSASIDGDFSEAAVRLTVERDSPETITPDTKMQTYKIRMSSYYELPITNDDIELHGQPDAYYEVVTQEGIKQIPLDPNPEKLLSFHIPPEKVHKVKSGAVSEAPTMSSIGKLI